MNTKVLSIALAAAIIALPLPASQLLAVGAPLAPAPVATIVAGDASDFSTLLADPFLIDRLSFAAPASFLSLELPAS
ncbi:MAG: hypothetical protein ABIO40_11705 [Devosia sp.]